MSAPSPPNLITNIIRSIPWWVGPIAFLAGVVLAYDAFTKFRLGFAEGQLLKVLAGFGASLFAMYFLYVGARVTAKITARHRE